IWQFRAIPENSQGAVIYLFTANKGLLAVIDPISRSSIHLLDSNTGYKLSQLDQFHDGSVGITDDGHLLVAEGVDPRTPKHGDHNPKIWSGLPDSPNSFEQLRWVDSSPEY